MEGLASLELVQRSLGRRVVQVIQLAWIQQFMQALVVFILRATRKVVQVQGCSVFLLSISSSVLRCRVIARLLGLLSLRHLEVQPLRVHVAKRGLVLHYYVSQLCCFHRLLQSILMPMQL